ncbi:MAG TPA: zf-TFIIB domain-containing protein, partial [Syntrophorhabdaceae bacterium]|nr:zf-TFIIB domain-containing protein [Syntrophorhabdaceae bacterium]
MQNIEELKSKAREAVDKKAIFGDDIDLNQYDRSLVPHKYLAEERKSLKELHFMRCPKCGMELIEIEYKGTKVDECSECRGVWLDAGELDTVSKMEKGALDRFFSVFSKDER